MAPVDFLACHQSPRRISLSCCSATFSHAYPAHSPADLPDASRRNWIAEPYVRLEMVTPTDYVGNLMELANGRRGRGT